MEEWRPVVGISFLEVSSVGRVRNTKTGTIYKPRFKKEGYEMIEIKLPIHRLVAEAFIPNPQNKPQIDHIVPVKPGFCNNRVENLAWVSQQENNAKREWKAGGSGERFISWNKTHKSFQIRYKGNNTLRKTLEEAIRVRDEWIKNNSS
jgi:hypothetical protein